MAQTSKRVRRTRTPEQTPAQWWSQAEADIQVRMTQAYDRMLKRMVEDANRQVFVPAAKAAKLRGVELRGKSKSPVRES